jgi:transcription antitermination factor NusB
MRKRTLAREIALQVLYQHDLRHKEEPLSIDEHEAFITQATDDPGSREYARILVDGTIATLDDVDARITEAARNWKVTRMATVDRCILRIAIFELKECEEIPPKVAINEAIELAKKFSTEQSGAFVNGILDRVYNDLLSESQGQGYHRETPC